ncbi:MAG: sugar ABC transporter permease [Lachnospiraceae bacterium]|nr:sugar ABC transporter permease [Lachnospiraceae bacterium]
MTKRKRNHLIGYFFLSLWLIGFLVFTLYPFVMSLYISLSKLTLGMNGTTYEYTGGDFYRYAFETDTEFLPKLLESVGFIAYATPIIVVIALLLAMMLNGKYKGRGFFRAVFFMPVVIMSGPVISELLGKYSLDFSEATPELFAFLNALPTVLRSPCLFVLENLVTVLWYSGVQILILLISIQRISPELYEAASIDGASGWEKFWKITLPHIMPTALICALYTVIQLANESTNAVNTYISARMFDHKLGYYSYSTAMAWIYTVVIIAILLVIVLLMKFFSGREEGRR